MDNRRNAGWLRGLAAGAFVVLQAIGALAFEPFVPSRFYGDPANGLPISNGGVATGILVSDWDVDCDITWEVNAVGGDPSWVNIVNLPATLAPGASETFSIEIDPLAPGFPTSPGTYSNTISITFSPAAGDPVTESRPIWLRISSTYFLQSAPYQWVETETTNVMNTAQLTGTGVPVPTNVVFTFYDHTYSNVYARGDGVLLFESPAAAPTANNTTLPDASSGAPGLFPLWMPTSLVQASVSYGAATIGARRAFVISWINVSALTDTSVRYDYQVVLFDKGMDECSEIRFQYRQVAQDSDAYGMGRDATVGLQSDGGFLAAHYTVNGLWRPAPGMEYDSCTNWVDGLSMDLADGQALRWTWGAREAETTPPTAIITPLAFSLDDIRYEVRFSEIVFGLDLADLTLGGAIPELSLAGVTGGGERYVAVVDNAAEGYGAVSLQLDAGTVYDLEGNANTGVVSPPRAIPYQETHLRDDFERGAGLWRASTNSGTTDFTGGGWEFGTPYPGVPGGPAAHSGTNCWGTFLGSPAWTSANGYPNGWFPGGSAFAMQAQLDSPRVHVGAAPSVRFWAYWALNGATASVLAVPGGSGEPVLLGTITGSGLGTWHRLTYRLPETLANRELSIRIVVSSPYGVSGPGLYLDDFEVYSLKEHGVYFLEFTPNAVNVPTVSNLLVVAYNTHTATVTHVEGVFAAPVAGVSVAPGTRVAFDPLPSGGMATSPVVCSVEVGVYPSPVVPVQATSSIDGRIDRISFPRLLLNMAGEPPGRHLVAVTGASGVHDWLGRPLPGDGGDASAGYQILWAGANGVIDPPRVDGAPGGDDRALYSTGPGRPYERFGAVSVAADAGLFSRAFSHNLPAGALLYARAWDGPTYDQSVAYGDSALKPLATGLAGEVVDFGIWTVGTPFQPARDWNGDGIPDGYAVTHPAFGIDPRETPDPDADLLRVMSVAVCSRAGFRPIRVELHGGRVYILYINNTGLNGAVEVRDPTLNTLLQSVTVSADAGQPLASVSGLAIDRLNGKLYVSEYTIERRIHRFGIGADGLLVYEATSVHARRPTDLAVDPGGQVYVADNQASIKRYPALLSGAPVAIAGGSGVPIERVSVFGDACYATYLDSTYQVHQVHRYDLAGSLGAVYGQPQQVPPQRGPGYLYAPAKVWEGVGGWLYVADRSNHRIQLFDAGGGYLAMTPATEPTPSALPGAFDMPTAVAVTNAPFGDHVIFVADEKNNRVQRLAVLLDVDRDGMDDAWEVQHGLDPADPGDALRDNDGDGLTNLGEYRLRRDPNDPDTNQDGLGDAFDLYGHPEVPPGTLPAAVTNLVAVVAQDGTTAAITVYYDKTEPLNAPVTFALSGGAYLPATPGVVNGDTASYTYVVQPGDAGFVSVVVSGPFQDPPVFLAADAFELSGAVPPAIVLDTLSASPEVAGAGITVQVSATFSAPVADAIVSIIATDGEGVLNAGMSPVAAPPTDLWSYPYLVSSTPTNRWFVVSVASSALPGTSPRRAGFAVIDPRITAFAMPPPAVTWNALTGVLYRVEARDSLLAGSWQTVSTTNPPGPAAVAPLTALPPGDTISNRFYRVVAP